MLYILFYYVWKPRFRSEVENRNQRQDKRRKKNGVPLCAWNMRDRKLLAPARTMWATFTDIPSI